MDINQQVLNVLSPTEPMKSGQIRMKIGVSQHALSAALKSLVLSGHVLVSTKWEYTLGEDPKLMNPKFSEHATKAEELEAKGLWRRAATEWQAAFDCVRETHLRTIAVNHIIECGQHHSRPSVEDEWVLSGNFVGNNLSMGGSQ